jgi:hypothetical protein
MVETLISSILAVAGIICRASLGGREKEILSMSGALLMSLAGIVPRRKCVIVLAFLVIGQWLKMWLRLSSS